MKMDFRSSFLAATLANANIQFTHTNVIQPQKCERITSRIKKSSLIVTESRNSTVLLRPFYIDKKYRKIFLKNYRTTLQLSRIIASR
jgi:hypothetical protein